RLNFPLRNEVMSALSLATIIVEAGETSGALIQAEYALSQGRRLYIMQNQIDKKELRWPRKLLERGARPLSSIENLVSDLETLELYAEGASGEKKQLSLF
ncbi:MAG: DNA-protecting protein DprA, partial [Bdellovibrionaceae bacterium]|nr:DNA-protecting protein DprA [Pseudobdellovibrionaceae bacterium]